jgi:hypothetical protein
MRDNQNHNLEATKQHNALLAEHYRQGSAKAAKAFESKKLAEWTKVEGIKVLRVADSNYVGVPVTGRRNSKWFTVIDLNDRSDIICRVTNREIHTWLFRKGN